MSRKIKTKERYNGRAAQTSGSFATELKTKSNISDFTPKIRPDVVLKTAETFNNVGKAAQIASEGLKEASHMIQDVTDDNGAGSNSYASNKISAIGSRASSGVIKYAKRTYNKSLQNTKRTLRQLKQKKVIPKGRNVGKSSIKTTQKTIKNTKKGIKTAQKTANASAKTAKASVKYAKKMYAISKQTAKAVWKVIKVTTITIKKIIEALIALIKGFIALLGTAGIVIIIVLIIVAIILVIINSPFGLFMGDDGEQDTPTIQDLIIDLDQQFNDEIVKTINEAGELNHIIIDIETADETYRVPNWNDVLSIFAVKLSLDEENPTNVFVMTKDKVEVLEKVFWEMNVIRSNVSEETVEVATPTLSPYPTPNSTSTPYPTFTTSPTPTPCIERTLTISLDSKTYIQGIAMYNFNKEQENFINELRSAEYYSLFLELCGIDTFNGLTPEKELELLNNLTNTTGGNIVRQAISRLGNPYSQAYRGMDSYVDCSYLARWCYNQAGITSFKAGTAASQAKYCDSNGFNVSYYGLQYGDLIFWSFNENGRYKNISHVGIYAGNGMVIDASSSRGMVVYRKLFGKSSIVIIGRPR